jgi:hypothetical protein
MAFTSLVVHELSAEVIQAGRDLIDALDREQVPIVAAYWLFDDETSRWTLVLASPVVEQSGPREFYRKVGEILRASGIEALILSHVTGVPSDDPIVVRLRNALKNVPAGEVRLTGNFLEGMFVPDVLVYRWT